MKRGSGTTGLRVGIVLFIAGAAMLSLLWSFACSNSSNGSLVGEWQQTDDGGFTADIFFNSNGTCGEFATQGGQSYCDTNCTYQLNGNTLTIVWDADGGAGYADIVQISVSGNTLTVEPPDGGQSAQLTRVNSNGSNSCP